MATKKRSNYYMGNPNVPAKGAEFNYTQDQAKEILKCRKSVVYFAENYFTIVNLDRGKEKIRLYKTQKKILKAIDKNRFFVLLASRQTGKSTIMTIYILWKALFFNDQRILLVANKEATAIEIFGRVRMAYELLPNWLKSPIDEGFGGYGKTSMGLENGSRISISTTTGTAARGQAVNVLILDEAAFVEEHLMKPFWASVFPIVSSSKNSKVFMCSTPNGTGNLFHSIYTGAVEGTNGWAHDKIHWSEIPGRDETWAKQTKAGLDNEELWLQEYEIRFLNAGSSSMNETLYLKLKENLKKPIEVLMDGKYKLWAHPNKERIYVAGVDVAEGIGGDYSVVKILDITDLREIEEVAEYYDNTIPVADFSNRVYDILGHWGKPLVCVERNNQGGQVVDRLAYDYGYQKVVSWGAKLAQRRNRNILGMVSSRNTKYHACSNARYYYSDRGAVVFRNEDSLEEVFKDFVKVNDTWKAASGKHDDRTMALIWALMVLDKDVCEQWFEIEEIDEYGKPLVISPIDYGLEYFENPTSIYNNEQVQRIEESRLAPMVFGGSTEQQDEIAQLQSEGWELLWGGMPYVDPARQVSQEYWEHIQKHFH